MFNQQLGLRDYLNKSFLNLYIDKILLLVEFKT